MDMYEHCAYIYKVSKHVYAGSVWHTRTHTHTHRKSVSRPVKHIESKKKSRKEKSACAPKQREINKNFTHIKQNMKDFRVS